MERTVIIDGAQVDEPVATHDVRGGGGLRLHVREWGEREGRPPYGADLPAIVGAEGAGTVVGTGERVAWLDVPGSSTSLLSSIRRIDTPDDVTVRFLLSRVDTQFVWALASPAASIVDEVLKGYVPFANGVLTEVALG